MIKSIPILRYIDLNKNAELWCLKKYDINNDISSIITSISSKSQCFIHPSLIFRYIFIPRLLLFFVNRHKHTYKILYLILTYLSYYFFLKNHLFLTDNRLFISILHKNCVFFVFLHTFYVQKWQEVSFLP